MFSIRNLHIYKPSLHLHRQYPLENLRNVLVVTVKLYENREGKGNGTICNLSDVKSRVINIILHFAGFGWFAVCC